MVIRTRPVATRRWLLLAGAVATVGSAWIVAARRPFTAPVARGALVWRALFLAFTAWEVIALFSSPRDDHPTLSSIADWIMSTHAGRAGVVLAWLAAGAALAFRRPRVA